MHTGLSPPHRPIVSEKSGDIPDRQDIVRVARFYKRRGTTPRAMGNTFHNHDLQIDLVTTKAAITRTATMTAMYRANGMPSSEWPAGTSMTNSVVSLPWLL